MIYRTHTHASHLILKYFHLGPKFSGFNFTNYIHTEVLK